MFGEKALDFLLNFCIDPIHYDNYTVNAYDFELGLP